MSAAALLFSSTPGNAEDKPGGGDQPETRTNVRVEVLLVALPEEKFLSMLPDLQSDTEIGGVVEKLMDGVKKKEVLLRGYPILLTVPGQRTVSESIREINTPGVAVSAPPQIPSADNADSPDKSQPTPAPAPTPYKAMISHSTGVTLEAEPAIQSDGQTVELGIDVKDVELAGAPADKNSTPPKGSAGNAKEPMFDVVNARTWLYLRSGQCKLLATQKISNPGGYVEVIIVRVVVLPSKLAGKPAE